MQKLKEKQFLSKTLNNFKFIKKGGKKANRKLNNDWIKIALLND